MSLQGFTYPPVSLYSVHSSLRPSNAMCTLYAVILLLTQISYIHSCYVYPPDVKDPCKDKECSFGAQCVPSIDGLTARCQCPDRCDRYGDSLGSKSVCGSDGKDYVNQCEMRRAACREMKDVRVKYFGKCGKILFSLLFTFTFSSCYIFSQFLTFGIKTKVTPFLIQWRNESSAPTSYCQDTLSNIFSQQLTLCI